MDRAYPRQRFTGTLLAICRQLEERHRGIVEYHLDFAPIAVHGKVATTIRSVRAYGSWARGAAACGNLDLAIEMDNEWVVGPWWGSRDLAEQPIDGVLVARAMLGRRPGVRYVSLDSALAGPQAIDPAEMKLVWRAPVEGRPPFHWRRAIASIRLDPTARRFPSSLICLPSCHELRGAETRASPGNWIRPLAGIGGGRRSSTPRA